MTHWPGMPLLTKSSCFMDTLYPLRDNYRILIPVFQTENLG